MGYNKVLADFINDYRHSSLENKEYTNDMSPIWANNLILNNTILTNFLFSNMKVNVIKYICNYYLNLNSDLNFSLKEKINLKTFIKYNLILNNKFDKIKYNINTYDNITQIYISIGMLLKYLNTKKKSMKKSIKAHVMLLKFIKNTINRLVNNNNFLFILRGLNLKFFKLLNLFNFIKKNRYMILYFLDHRISHKTRNDKKLKAIKRKLQKKNLSKLNETFNFYKIYSKSEFTL